ncbi:hypothetical protein [Cognatishimia sp. F0-27]|uniref:hypothetical protein n=1 Tax=Cognatishimia sp. F0-27 TaxID=2816855 RepID=UPI001D0CAAB0|nr:hypothetical protein [Cognatishimia sp. F0-27]MCC1492469.1 hypothetical protein [Cognatishimia sp. F0-27]
MKGWQIFMHSVQLVLRNLTAALQVSGLLYLVQVAAQISAWSNPAPVSDDPIAAIGAQASFGSVLLSIAGLIASLWIAVGWHRYVLANETPRGWVPVWQGPYLLGYLGRSVLIGLLIAIAIMIAGIPVGLLAAVVPSIAALFAFGLVGLGGYLFFRLGVMLPAGAVGKPLKLKEAWEATRDDDGAVIVLAFIVMGGSALIQLPSLIGGAGTIVDLVYQIVVGWFATVIGISVLTTLYGHYVEGRPID